MNDRVSPGLDAATWYEIEVGGGLDAVWSSWFDGLQITQLAGGVTRLAGPIRDEAALHGLLTKIRDLGLKLVSVRRVGPSFAYEAEMEFEQTGWSEITRLVEQLTEDECLAPGYFVDPDWSTRDLIAHLTAWFTEARAQLLDIATRTYVAHPFDVDARNAATLAALDGKPWGTVWSEATTARRWMLEAWYAFRQPDETATAWIRKAGAEHYAEHVPRLRSWVAEVIRLRDRPGEDTWGW